MNRVLGFFVILFSAGILQAQIPNPGFETWASGNPTGWYSSSATIPGSIDQSASAYGGSWAARGNVASFISFNISPFLNAGENGQGFPVSQRYAQLSGFYQFTSVGGDALYVTVAMQQAGLGIGAGFLVTQTNQTNYAQFDIPIFYGVGGVPDTAYIQFSIVDTLTGILDLGSFFIVDDLSFSGITAVDDPAQTPVQFSLRQNYPNPFNPSTIISFTIPGESPVSLRIFDVLGREIESLVSEALHPGAHERLWDASGHPAGVYYYTLRAGDFSETRKLLLVK